MTYSFRELDLKRPNVIFESRDFLDAKSLHNKLFPNTDASFDWLRWYVNIASYSATNISTRVYGAFYDEELVGTWCVEPKKLRLSSDNVVNVGRAFATGVHSDHRRGGLFTDLSKYAIESEKSKKDYEWILGFPQVGRPVINAHLKSGWQHVQTIYSLGYVPKKENWSLSLRDVAKNSADHSIEPLTYDLSFVETSAYKQDRWMLHPELNYTRLSLHIDGVRNDVVLKTYGSSWHILDLHGTTEGVVNVLRAAQTLAYRHKATELTIWCAENEFHRKQIELCGFIFPSTATPTVELLAVPINENSVEKLKCSTSHFQMGVEEIY